MKKCLLPALLVVLCGAAPVLAAANFTGTWMTTFGPVTLVQKGKMVTGSYYDGKAHLEGVVTNNKLTFNYKEKAEKGTGTFQLSKDGNSFVGKYHAEGSKQQNEWNGTRK